MKAKLRKTYNTIIRVFIIIMTFGFLYNEIFIEKDFSSVISFYPTVSTSNSVYLIIIFTLLLFVINYLLEAIKWQFFISPLEKISLWNSFKAVLTGVSVSMFMPNRVGDYLGRVFILKSANRIQAVISTIVGSMSQLITTLLFGSIALLIAFPKYFNLDNQINVWLYSGLWAMVIIGDFTIVFFYLNFGAFTSVIKRISGKGYEKIKKYSEVFALYKYTDMLFMIAISMLRYLVFSFQFYLLILLFNVNIGYFEAMLLIALVYLAMAIIPTVAITEIGIRGSVSVFIFTYFLSLSDNAYINQELGVASASTLLWLINLVIPAIIGAVFVFNLKFFRKK